LFRLDTLSDLSVGNVFDVAAALAEGFDFRGIDVEAVV